MKNFTRPGVTIIAVLLVVLLAVLLGGCTVCQRHPAGCRAAVIIGGAMAACAVTGYVAAHQRDKPQQTPTTPTGPWPGPCVPFDQCAK